MIWRINQIFLLFLLGTMTTNAALVEECPGVMSFPPEALLKGPVKTYKEQLVDIRHGQSGADKEIPRSGHYFAHYDQNGNMEEEILYSGDNIGYKNLYTYDPSGRLQTVDEFGFSGTRTGKVLYEYDESERTITHSLYEMAQLRSRTVDRYDKRGHVIERSRYYSNGERYFNTAYRFDSAGQLVERKQTGKYGDELLECTYDAKDRLARSRFQRKVNSKPVTASEKRYEYSEARVTETTCTGRNLSKCYKSAVFSRTAHGEKKYIFYDKRGSASLTTFLKEDGRMTRLESAPSPMIRCRALLFEYKNDEFGNWIKKVTLCQKAGAKKSEIVPDEAVYRDIAYYKALPGRNIPAEESMEGAMPLVDVDSLDRPIRLPKAPKP